MINLILQVHITGKCNLRCRHCYIDEHCTELSFKDFKKILRQYDCWARDMEKLHNEKVIKNLHITGGEPLIHSEFDKIISYLTVRRNKYRIAFMTNGTLLDKRIIRKFKRLRIKPLQISLDGVEKTHDSIRGNGNFKAVVKAMDFLYENNIPCRVSFTANADNYREFGRVAEICRAHHVNSLWSDRYIPFEGGSEKHIDKECIEDYICVLRHEKNNPENIKAGLRVENCRALQFLNSSDEPFTCHAGERFMAIDEKGNIMPCRRLPVICGNVKIDTVSYVYFNSDVFIRLRKHEIDEKCKMCEHSEGCKGGARCMSYAVNGDFCSADPSCFME